MKYSWDGHYCENPSWEHDPEGLCILHSLKPEKDKSIFEQSLKEKLAQEDFDFREVFFPGPISFAKQKFTKPANFHGARFNGWADFWEAEFTGEADFSHARFSQAALFTKAKFSDQAEFNELEIAGEADFGGAGFDGHGVFQQINEPRDGAAARPFTASFRFLHLGPKTLISFQDLSLAQVSFLGTDLRQVRFHNVKWHWLYGRQAVYDEILLTKRPGPLLISLTSTEGALDYEKLCAKVEELYRYLKLNYEHEGDHKQAGDFHFGEMEMHRRANPWRRWFPLSWYNLYRVLSGYGERPLRALRGLVGVVAGLALSLQWLGLKTAEGYWANFTESLVYVLEHTSLIRLIRPEWPKPISEGGHLLAAISHFLILGQAALFLLAIRNRLGRRH